MTAPVIPEGWVRVGAVTLIKCVDEDGDVQLVTHADDGISTYEAIGITVHTTDLLRKALTDDDD